MLNRQYTALARESYHANHQQQAGTTDDTELAIIALLLRHQLLAVGSDQHALDLDRLRKHQVTVGEPLNFATAERKRLRKPNELAVFVSAVSPRARSSPITRTVADNNASTVSG